MLLTKRRTRRASRRLADCSAALEYLSSDKLHSLDNVKLEGDQVFHIDVDVNLVPQKRQQSSERQIFRLDISDDAQRQIRKLFGVGLENKGFDFLNKNLSSAESSTDEVPGL